MAWGIFRKPLEDGVENAGSAAGCLEACGVGDDAVGEVSAVAPAHDRHFIGVCDALLHDVVYTGEDVLDVDVVLPADQLGEECVAIPC